MRPVPFVVLATLSLTLAPLASAVAQNDAGSGGDAPNDGMPALVVPAGSFTGVLDTSAGDRQDWYRLNTTGAKVVHLHVGTPGYIVLVAAYVNDTTKVFDGSSYADIDVVLGAGERFTFVMYRPYGTDTVPYDFWTTVNDLPDVAVTTLSISTVTTATDLGTIPVTTQHDVSFSVRNGGPGPSANGHLLVDARTLGSTRVLLSEPIVLAPGETRTMTIRWDGTGQLGDVDVHARVTSSFDTNASNDARAVRSYIFAQNSGVSLDLLNHGASSPAGGAWTHYNGRTASVGASVVAVGAEVGLDRDDGTTWWNVCGPFIQCLN